MKFILTFCLIISQIVFAQVKFFDGYIISKNQTDTTKGKIEYLNWSENPRTIIFQNANSEKQEFDISKLSAFGVYGKENYIVKKVNLDETPISKDNLMLSRQLIIKKDTSLALLVLLQAKYSLYHFKDANEKEHFYINESGITKELINHKFLLERNAKFYEIDDRQYLKQIDTLFSNCNKRISTDDLAYEVNALTEKLIEFNDCMGCKYTCFIKKQNDKGFSSFEILGGLSTEFINHEYLTGMINRIERKRGITPGYNIGVSYSIHSKRDFGNRIARFEAIFENMTVKSRKYGYSVNLPYININVLYRRKLSEKYLLYGFGGNAQIWNGSYSNYVGKFYNTFDIIRLRPYILADFGFFKNNLEIFFRTRLAISQTDLLSLNKYALDSSSIENGYFNLAKFQFLCTYSFNMKRQ